MQSDLPCEVCFYSKQKILSFYKSTHKSINNFDLIHMNIWGQLYIPSINGHRYFLTVVDDKSKFTWIFLMKHKSETQKLIKAFVSMVHTQYNIKIKFLRSDNGSEFILKYFYKETSIIH